MLDVQISRHNNRMVTHTTRYYIQYTIMLVKLKNFNFLQTNFVFYNANTYNVEILLFLFSLVYLKQQK